MNYFSCIECGELTDENNHVITTDLDKLMAHGFRVFDHVCKKH